MRTIHQKMLAMFTIILMAMIAQPVSAQIAVNDIPDLTQEQRTALEKLRDDHFIERNRMDDKVKQERMEMRKRHDQKLRSILNEKQYYAFKEKNRDRRMNRNGNGRKGQGNCHSPQSCRNF